MHIPSAAQLLDVWEWGAQRCPAERSLALVGLAHPETSQEALQDFPIGRIAAELVTLRQQLFGSKMSVLADCGQCGECIEVCFDLGDLPTPAEDSRDTLRVEVGGFRIDCRLPSCGDLIAITRCADVHRAKRGLLARCLIAVEADHGYSAGEELPAHVIQAVATEMERSDALADMRLPVTCPTCYVESRPAFDILSILWTELDAWARRMLGEVHALASVYHWSEKEILAMSPWRRRAYMEVAGA